MERSVLKRYYIDCKLAASYLMPQEPALARYRVIIEQDEDGVFVAEVPSLPGCVSQGRTSDEALSNIRRAIAGYLESLRARDEPVPPGSEEVVVDVP
jgi:predicted RNase H-like HicB family nuclease